MKATVVVSVCFALLVCTAPACPSGFLPHKPHLTLTEKVTYFERSVRKDMSAILWLRSPAATRNAERVRELRWYQHALAWHRQLLAAARSKVAPPLPPHYAAWLCIHHYEGSWTDPDAPYYGGLQMDLGFQAHYGGALLRTKGTADHWTPLEQMWVAERAYQSGRGFYPWPNTARYCGLL